MYIQHRKMQDFIDYIKLIEAQANNQVMPNKVVKSRKSKYSSKKIVRGRSYNLKMLKK